MDYKIKRDKKNEVTITWSLTEEEWLREQNDAYESEKGKYNVQGFRKGKAPKKSIENAYGSGVFLETALDNALDKYYREILMKEREIVPVDHPSISVEKFDEKNLSIIMTITTLPEVVLGDYKGVEIEGESGEVTDAEVEEELKRKAETQARKVEVTDRGIVSGDFATIDFAGSVDGVAFPGGTSTGYELEIGSSSFIPGFEEQLIGMKTGEEKDITVTFPADYHSVDLASKEAVFHIVLHKIAVKESIEINDEWASNTSEFDTVDLLRADIRAKLIDSAEKKAKINNENKLVAEICKRSTIEIPDIMVENELNDMMKEIEQKLAYQGVTLDDYLKYINGTREKLREDSREDAFARIRMQLVLGALLKIEKIEATQEEIDAKITEMASKYGKNVDEIKKVLPPEQISYLGNEIKMEKLLDFLTANNKITKKSTK